MEHINPFDSGAQAYEDWFAENPQLFQAELAAVRQLLPQAGQGVEIGVGTGLFAAALGIPCGLEPSLDMARLARQKGIEVIQGYAEDMPLPDQSYDFALMVTVDCFLQDVAAAFRQVCRILKPQGRFIIAFLDKGTPLGQIYDQHKDEDVNYRFATFHTAAEIEAYLTQAGFAMGRKIQTVFSFDAKEQPVRDGHGEGLFAVAEAYKL
ncbi:MAG: class I SAM-dependent methyltransferase [Firmicutes bacterium]|nr:class I SAM-dependent methyltransferase [Bacillota bacterium]